MAQVSHQTKKLEWRRIRHMFLKDQVNIFTLICKKILWKDQRWAVHVMRKLHLISSLVYYKRDFMIVPSCALCLHPAPLCSVHIRNSVDFHSTAACNPWHPCLAHELWFILPEAVFYTQESAMWRVRRKEPWASAEDWITHIKKLAQLQQFKCYIMCSTSY